MFCLQEGKLLGHIISKEGTKIDPSKIEVVLKINVKEVQSLIGKINFMRRFIPNLKEILKNITKILRRDTEVKWNIEAKHSFDRVR